MIKCAVIDDEPLAREIVVDYIHKVDFLELVAEANNPIELSVLLERKSIDLIFLDIQTPVINGIDYLKSTSNLPMVIFTTAYSSYALESYQLDVMDYLLKPITFDRFFKAVSKTKEYFQLTRQLVTSKNHPADDYFFVKCDSKYEKIHINEILFVQAMQNYVVIHTGDEKYMTLSTMKSIEEKLDAAAFIRVHKSYIIARTKVTGLENHEVHIGENRIPVSRNFRKELMDNLLKDKLW